MNANRFGRLESPPKGTTAPQRVAAAMNARRDNSPGCADAVIISIQTPGFGVFILRELVRFKKIGRGSCENSGPGSPCWPCRLRQSQRRPSRRIPQHPWDFPRFETGPGSSLPFDNRFRGHGACLWPRATRSRRREKGRRYWLRKCSTGKWRPRWTRRPPPRCQGCHGHLRQLADQRFSGRISTQ